ncbi:MAG: NADPH-dependent 2,4-dienoyl-CoA reductase/sulfur reductase-like enzyme, partial [Halobacteriales archaeon]
MSKTFVIAGGDAAGMSAASKAKRENPNLDVIVFEKGEWVSYGACGLPYYVKGDIDDIEDLVAVPAEDFREERDIDLRTHHEVVSIDPEAKSVSVDGPDETFEQPYDQLLIATGASAIVPPFDGIDLDGVYTMHSLPEGERLKGILEGTETHPEG